MSELQFLLVQRMNRIGGRRNVVLALKKLMMRVPDTDKHHFENMIIYFGRMFYGYFDAESLSLCCQNTGKQTLSYLKKLQERDPNPSIDFFIELIQFNLEFIRKVKKLN